MAERNVELKKEIISTVSRKYLHALDIAMADSGEEYSVGNKKDETLCLIFNDGQWEVFFAEKMIESDKKCFDDISDACIEIIERSCADEKEIDSIKQTYINEINRDIKADFSSKTVYNLLNRIAVL